MHDQEIIEWCFVVSTASGAGEVRVRSSGEVVVTSGSSNWVSLDGISFPAEGAIVARYVRSDVVRLDAGSDLLGSLASERLLYHYTSDETAHRYILKSRALRLGSFEKTNDPREAKEWLFAVVAPIGVAPPGEAIRVSAELGDLLRQRTRLACFCSDGHPPQAPKVQLADGQGWRHARMWAQYGDSHRGVVLVFDRRRLLENARGALGGRGHLFFGDVLYVDHRHPGDMLPFIVNHKNWVATPHAEYAKRHLELHGSWLFFTKHSDWGQEHESRIIFFGAETGDAFVPIDGALKEICLAESVPKPSHQAYLDASKDLSCSLTRVTWRNGLPVRCPVDI